MSALDLIKKLDLKPHPEGGHYRETFRASGTVDAATNGNGTATMRSAGTAILYLLIGKQRSHFHRIDADELWFFHSGGPLNIYSLMPNGDAQMQTLSLDNPQVMIPQGHWFGAMLENPSNHCLCSCAVVPGFEFSGFEMADRQALLKEWPSARDWIEDLTRQA